MKQLLIMFTRIFLLFLWWPLLTAGQQEPGGLYLTGKITTEQGNVNGAIIRMTRNGQPMKDYQVLPDGRFDLRFEFNNDYVLIFQREENFPQKIVISTQVPAEVLRRDRKFPPFPVDVNLFTEIKGVDRTFSENAIMKIFYSPSVDNFIPEIYYNNPQIKRLIDQAIWQSQNVSREAGLLRKLSAAELAELKKEYDELLKKAGSEFDKGDYIASLGDYKSASRIFPSEQYPKDRMAEINDLIAILGLQAELDRQNAEKYNGFIREADRLFGVKSWPGARENYTQALFVKPGDAYANGQLSAIDKAIALEEQTRLADEKARLEAERLAQLEAERKAAEADKARQEAEKARQEAERLARLEADKEQQYTSAVANADQAFTRQEYQQAITGYKDALKIKPGEVYPTTRITEAETILAELAAARKAYDAAVATGDKAFRQQNYRQSRRAFEDAQKALSNEPYPAQMLEKIDAIEEELERLAQEKDRIAAQKAAEELAARQAAEAEKLRLAEEKARAEAEEQARLQSEQALREEQYQSTIKEADRLAGENLLIEAVGKFRAALEIKPRESYPIQRIEEIRGIIARQNETRKAYETAVATGDQEFKKQNYGPARNAFTEAQNLIPAEKYPGEMISKIETLEAEQARIAEEKARQEAERLAKLEADRQAAEAEKARIAAEKAAKEEAARLAAEAERQRLADEKARLAEEKARIEAERLAKLEAERQAAEAEKARIAAEKAAKEEAARLAAEAERQRLADEKARLAEEKARIEAERLAKLEAERQAAEAEKARIAAEKAAKEEAARLAAEAERQRLADEKARLAEEKARIEAERLVKLEADRQAAEAEKARIAAEKAAKEEAARLAAEAERQRLADEKARLAEEKARIEAERLAKLEAERQAAEAEKARIAAEKAAKEEAARLAAEAERQRLADEKARLAEEKARIEAERLAKLEADRQAAEAEKARIAAEKAAKEEAARLAAEAERQRLADEKARIAEEKARIEAERLAKLEAERQAAEAEKARIAAEKAAKEEAARLAAEAERQRLADEKARLAAQKEAESAARTKVITDETEALYAGMITTADQTFTAKEYNVSRAWYYKALEVKPGEPYPTGQIAEINRIVGSQQMSQREREFQETIDKGDEAFRAGEMAVARGWYNRSLTIKPEDQYARSQIADIQMKIAEKLQGHTETSFLDYLKEGDKALAGKNYHVARVWYHRARQLKPDDPRVAEKLQNLEKAMAEE